MSAGTKVRIASPSGVPSWSTWDDDKGRTSTTVKRRLQAMFFQGNKRLQAEIVHISKESERERLHRTGRVKVRVRDQSGCMLVITADPGHLKSMG